MRSFCRAGTLAALTCLMLMVGHAAAHPHRGELVDLSQPDGSQVQVVVWGDEFYVRAETPNGYTLIVDPVTGYICYALATGDGDLVSSGVVYDGVMNDAELLALGISKGAVHSQARRDELATAKRNRLAPNQGKIRPNGSSLGKVSSDYEILADIGDPVPSGTVTGLVVLVDFPDRKYTISSTEVDNAFNSTGTYGSTWHGSIRKWSEQISNNVTSVQHKVVGYYTAKYNVSHYNAPTAEWDYSTSDELYDEVYAYIDANVDLTSYAVNRRLPSLALIYAGATIARGWAMALWPHGGCGGYSYRTSEGVTIDKCFLTNLGTRTPIDLETFRHELGHSVFFWPDTYDYDDDSQSGGGFATETDMPCAPFRMWAGWITPTNVTSSTGVYSLAANGSSFLRYNNSSKTTEYFIAEYAKKTTFRAPPDQGLLIWHIDENGDNSWQDMTATRHYAMSVEQADGKFDLEHDVRAGDGDLYHAGDKTRFDNTTTPNSNWWNGSTSGFKLCDIGGITTDTMTVNVGCVAAGGSTATGGTTSTGGAASSGGSTAKGGTSSAGGAVNSGGSTAKGGTNSTGGNANSAGATAKGGTSNSGGVTSIGGTTSSSGGNGITGGTTNTGGNRNTGGTLQTGGVSANASGGIAAANGGTANGTGGALAATGGAIANTGGAITNTGGTVGASVGGSPATGGLKATGGVAPWTGGVATTVAFGGAATSTTGTATNGDAEEAGGCSCRVPTGTTNSGLSLIAGAVAALALGLRRRRV